MRRKQIQAIKTRVGAEFYNSDIDYAIQRHHEEIVIILLSSNQWKKFLQNTSFGCSGKHNLTPLRRLIEHSPLIASATKLNIYFQKF